MSQDEPPEDDRSSSNIAVAVGVIVLLVIAWFVFRAFMANQQMEQCRIEGRRDCDPIAIPNQ